MCIIERNIVQNPLLRDGTPRSEKGYRAFVQYQDGRLHPETHLPINVYAKSPLFATEAEAMAWAP